MQTQSISVISFLYIYCIYCFFFSLGERCVVMHGALRGCVQGQKEEVENKHVVKTKSGLCSGLSVKYKQNNLKLWSRGEGACSTLMSPPMSKANLRPLSQTLLFVHYSNDISYVFQLIVYGVQHG